MKSHYLLALSLVFLALPYTTPVYASSGACSDHLGVNCNAGSDVDGSVICNDGWRDSSVMFLDASECQAPKSCIAPITSGCTDQNQYNAMAQQLNVNGDARYSPDIASGQLYTCQSQILAYQAELSAYQACLDGGSVTVQTVTSTPVPQDYDYQCRIKYGDNAKSSDQNGDCTCVAGYTLSNNQCVSIAAQGVTNAQNACHDRLGVQAYVDLSGNCVCNQGAEIDPVTGKCESSLVLKNRRDEQSASSTVSAQTSSSTISTPVMVPIYVVKKSTDKPVTPKYFIGTPKTKTDLLNCFVVGNNTTKKYYVRGSKTIKTMVPKGKQCFVDENAAKKLKFKKAK